MVEPLIHECRSVTQPCRHGAMKIKTYFCKNISPAQGGISYRLEGNTSADGNRMNRFQQGFLGGTHKHKPRSGSGLAPILKANIHKPSKQEPW